MLTYELLQSTYEEQMAGSSPGEAIRLVLPDTLSLDDDAPITEIERFVQGLGTFLLEEAVTKTMQGVIPVEALPQVATITALYTGIALGALAMNRHVLEGEVPDAPPAE